MKNLFSIFLAFLFSVIAFSQESELLKDEDYIRFEKESLEFYNSEEYQNYYFTFKKLSDKLSGADFDYMIDDEAGFNDWIEQNLGKTSFDTKEEALEIFKKYQDAQPDKINKKLKAIYDNVFELGQKYGFEAVQKATSERVFDKVVLRSQP